MSLLNRVVSRLSCEEIFEADCLNRFAVKMELPFRLILQLAFGDPAPRVLLLSGDIHSKHGRILDYRHIIGPKPLSMPGRTLFGHEACVFPSFFA
jgi:hypothetical protein